MAEKEKKADEPKKADATTMQPVTVPAKVDKPVEPNTYNVPDGTPTLNPSKEKSEKCPYCSPATYWNKKGIKSHVRANHPDKYSEFIGEPTEPEPIVASEPKPKPKVKDQLTDLTTTDWLLIGAVIMSAIGLVILVYMTTKPEPEPVRLVMPPALSQPSPKKEVYLGGSDE